MHRRLLHSFDRQRPSRRQFLRFCCGAGAIAAGGLAGRTAAIEPIARQGASEFKYSLAAYSYRKLFTARENRLSLEDFIADAAKMRLGGVELTSYYFPANLTPEYLVSIKSLCFRLGLDVSGTAIGNDFCLPPGPDRDEQLALTKRWIDNSVLLGAPVIRIFAGKQRSLSFDEAKRLVIEGIESSCQLAGERGVHLALENHGGLTAKADDMLDLVRAVKSPWFGVNLDTGNFHSDDIEGDLAKLAPYALNVQVKVVVSGPDGKKRPTDFARLAKLLADSGYRGYIVLEYEEDEDPRVACPRFVDAIRGAFSSV
jgi:sugar phosphate isomerase/epimerase